MAAKTKKTPTINNKPKFSMPVLTLIILLALAGGIYVVYQSFAAGYPRCGASANTCASGTPSGFSQTATLYSWRCTDYYIAWVNGKPVVKPMTTSCSLAKPK